MIYLQLFELLLNKNFHFRQPEFVSTGHCFRWNDILNDAQEGERTNTHGALGKLVGLQLL